MIPLAPIVSVALPLKLKLTDPVPPDRKLKPAICRLAARTGLTALVALVNEAVLVVRLSEGALPPVQFDPVAYSVPLVEPQEIAVCALKCVASKAVMRKNSSRFMTPACWRNQPRDEGGRRCAWLIDVKDYPMTRGNKQA